MGTRGLVLEAEELPSALIRAHDVLDSVVYLANDTKLAPDLERISAAAVNGVPV